MGFGETSPGRPTLPKPILERKELWNKIPEPKKGKNWLGNFGKFGQG